MLTFHAQSKPVYELWNFIQYLQYMSECTIPVIQHNPHELYLITSAQYSLSFHSFCLLVLFFLLILVFREVSLNKFNCSCYCTLLYGKAAEDSILTHLKNGPPAHLPGWKKNTSYNNPTHFYCCLTWNDSFH